MKILITCTCRLQYTLTWLYQLSLPAELRLIHFGLKGTRRNWEEHLSLLWVEDYTQAVLARHNLSAPPQPWPCQALVSPHVEPGRRTHHIRFPILQVPGWLFSWPWPKLALTLHGAAEPGADVNQLCWNQSITKLFESDVMPGKALAVHALWKTDHWEDWNSTCK